MKNDILRIRIASDLKTQFQELAVKKGMGMSEYLIYMIRRELEKENPSE
jgi:antitoxin component of RelBE/YafQ-DinJ toxin-antitoxin module